MVVQFKFCYFNIGVRVFGLSGDCYVNFPILVDLDSVANHFATVMTTKVCSVEPLVGQPQARWNDDLSKLPGSYWVEEAMDEVPKWCTVDI